MKLMIASDVHGCTGGCKKMLEAYSREDAEKLVLLGDLLYHGPRNGVPADYDPAKVIDLLNSAGGELLCIRGNCDSEVDQMVLDFPIMAEFAVLFANGRRVYLTHGHIFNEENPPKVKEGDIVLSGHTHVPVCHEKGGILYMNPGSTSIPKGGSTYSYMTLDGEKAEWKDMDGNVYMAHRF